MTTTTYIGPEGGLWSTPENWSNGVPANGDTVLNAGGVADISDLALASLSLGSALTVWSNLATVELATGGTIQVGMPPFGFGGGFSAQTTTATTPVTIVSGNGPVTLPGNLPDGSSIAMNSGAVELTGTINPDIRISLNGYSTLQLDNPQQVIANPITATLAYSGPLVPGIYAPVTIILPDQVTDSSAISPNTVGSLQLGTISSAYTFTHLDVETTTAPNVQVVGTGGTLQLVPVLSTSFSAPDAALVEAGVNGSGTATSVATFTDDGTVTYFDGVPSFQDTLVLNGTYGTALFDYTTNTLTYSLDNTRAATQALGAGQQVSDVFDVTGTENVTASFMDLGQANGSVPVSFAITGSNDAPVAQADTLNATAGQAVTVSAATLLANDTDVDTGDVLTLTGVGNAAHGAVSLVNGQVRFAADAGYTGNAAGFDYTISDSQGATATGHVSAVLNTASQTPRYIVLTNNADDQDYTTSTGAVLVVAQNGDDRVVGSAFNDSLNGGAGNDRLVGGAGNDVITGGAGADRMQGGTGNDTFVFNVGDLMPTTASLDQIIDFHGAGRIDGPENDFLLFKGFDAGTTLQFDHAAAGNAALQYYKVTDSVNASRSGMLLVQMADGNAHLAAGDYSFSA